MKNNTKSQKVFGVGFHKTGTSSLGKALEKLGYQVAGHFIVSSPLDPSEVKERAFKMADRHDAVQDSPWFMLYQELDARYPDSKFILTVRPTDEWVRSIVRHFGSSTTARREWIYGVGKPKGNENVYAKRYERHNREVREYFEDRPKDLLEIRITEGEGWEKLCPFLDCPVPDESFPHAMNSEDRRRRSLMKWVYDKSPSCMRKIERKVWKATSALRQ